jgi:hypothetical protein
MALALLLSRARTPSKSTTTWDAYSRRSARPCRQNAESTQLGSIAYERGPRRKVAAVSASLGGIALLPPAAERLG